MNRSKKAVKHPRQVYMTEAVPPFTISTAMEEASRCLLCLDAPCSRDCPAETNPGDFIRAVRFRNFKGAAEIVRSNNILGGVCARVCPYEKLCEEACSRTGIDKPIKIGRIQRFITDYEKATNFKVLDPVEPSKEKVAMIGSGPASLACAAGLALKGYAVTIFEEKERAGGVMSYGVVPARLPQYVVNEEIQYIRDLGVEFVMNTKIGKDKTLEKLKAEGFKAFFLGIGNQDPILLNVPGKDLEGVTNAVDYLAEAKSTDGRIYPGNRVVVIGGGDVAMDCATTSRLLGSKKTMVLYRRTRAEAPANKEEIAYCESIGIQFFYGFKPGEIIEKEGKVSAIKGEGFEDESSITLEADTIVFAVGQKPNPEVRKLGKLEFTSKNGITADGESCMTNIPGIFAGGDIVNGGNTVVEAVRIGKLAAKSIEKYLTEEVK